jgi:hypothetical protein
MQSYLVKDSISSREIGGNAGAPSDDVLPLTDWTIFGTASSNISSKGWKSPAEPSFWGLGKLDHKHGLEKEERAGSKADAYGLDGLEYGYEEEYGVDWGHDKELPVWSSYKVRIDLTARRD